MDFEAAVRLVRRHTSDVDCQDEKYFEWEGESALLLASCTAIVRGLVVRFERGADGNAADIRAGTGRDFERGREREMRTVRAAVRAALRRVRVTPLVFCEAWASSDDVQEVAARLRRPLQQVMALAARLVAAGCQLKKLNTSPLSLN